MNTPICDFVQKYAAGDTLRLHMPGHKGIGDIERLDITEITGADSLYEADGIIAQSEQNAAQLFGANTFYSAEGSSQCIRAMLYLVSICAADNRQRPLVAAGRNAHKTFVSAAALLDVRVDWLAVPEAGCLSCPISAEYVEKYLDAADELPTAVYLTSPDYLGNMLDIAAIAQVCRKKGVLLLIDNAHGAYLKFLAESRHPMDLGADMCCDSAHKTLPALTGAAYLHISRDCPEKTMKLLLENVRHALALFGSTSPSYLILASLDRVNRVLCEGFAQKTAEFAVCAEALKQSVKELGLDTTGDEPLKLTVMPKSYGYTGTELAQILRRERIEAEFFDADHTVLMLSPLFEKREMSRILEALSKIPRRKAICTAPPGVCLTRAVMDIRKATLLPSESVPTDKCAGRVAAVVTAACPPAVPVVMPGEEITPEICAVLSYYGIQSCKVVKIHNE